MSKYLLTNAGVLVNNVDLSNHAFSLDTPESAEQVDVSGFSATRTREFLPGVIDQTITIGFLQDFAGSSVHETLSALFASGTTFPLKVYAVGTTGTNFGGTASIYEYNGLQGELNARGEVPATFKPASNSLFAWSTA